MDTGTGTPSASGVVGRVWRGGVFWGPVTAGCLVACLAAWVLVTEVVGGEYRSEEIRQAVGIFVVVLVLALAHGLVVGFVTGLAGGVLLLALRTRGAGGVVLAWLCTLVVLTVTCAVVGRIYPDVAIGLVILVCPLAAAYPLWRTLRRALRPSGAPA